MEITINVIGRWLTPPPCRPHAWGSGPGLGDPRRRLYPQDVWTFQLGHLAGLSTEQEYELLSTPSELERQVLMLEHLDSLIPMVKEMEELRRKAKLNGHFRRFSSPDFLRGLEKK